MASNLVISGGPLHDFAATSAALVELLSRDGIDSTVVADPADALDRLADRSQPWDMVTVNALLWPMPAKRHAHLRKDHAFQLADRQARALDSHVRGGGGLLACHSAVICFDGDDRWVELVGARWDWERSGHPPLGTVPVTVTAAGHEHPLASGVDDFPIVDEVYGFLDCAPAIAPLLTSPHGGVDHPLLWARRVGQGRVVVDLLGHDVGSIDHPQHAEILRRSGRWLTGPRLAGRDATERTGASP